MSDAVNIGTLIGNLPAARDAQRSYDWEILIGAVLFCGLVMVAFAVLLPGSVQGASDVLPMLAPII